MIVLHRDSQRVYDGEREIILQPRMYELLLLLAERKGKFTHMERLLGSLWDGCEVTESAVWNTVYKIRKSLGADFIETRAKVGYAVTKIEVV